MGFPQEDSHRPGKPITRFRIKKFEGRNRTTRGSELDLFVALIFLDLFDVFLKYLWFLFVL